MARSFLTPIDLNKNELRNAVVQNIAQTPPSGPPTPAKGQIFFDSAGNNLYWYDGTNWVSARGGLTFGTITAETTFGAAKGDGSAVTAARSDHTHGNPTHVNSDHNAINLNALAAPTADVSMGGFKITNVGAPISATDATNKNYVDNALVGLTWKTPVRLASTAQQALTGLTAIDGVTPIANDRILLKNQTAPAENGIWLAQSGAWTRALDADSSAELVNAAVFVAEGTLNQDTAWVQTANAPITVGTTAITWVQFAGGGTIVPGAGLSASGNTFNVGANANGSIIVAADDISVAYAGTGGNNGSAGTAARSDHAHTGIYPAVATTITAGAGLTGGGDLSANRTIDVVAADASLVVAADSITRGALTGDVTAPQGSNATTIANSAVTTAKIANDAVDNTKLANMPALTVKGNVTGSAADPQDLTPFAFAFAFSLTQKVVVGCAAATSTVVNHLLNTQDVSVQVHRSTSPFDVVDADIEMTDVNNVTVRFAVAPTAGQYRIVVAG